MSNEIFKAAARYAANLGWPIVQNYGMREDGGCMCRLGKSCGMPGKHPVNDEWMLHATNDEESIAEWFENGERWNIGIPLGPSSGVVDTEWDDEKSLGTAKRFGLIKAPTLGDVSSRGGHRLWKLDHRLIDLDKGVKKIDGLEVRFGRQQHQRAVRGHQAALIGAVGVQVDDERRRRAGAGRFLFRSRSRRRFDHPLLRYPADLPESENHAWPTSSSRRSATAVPSSRGTPTSATAPRCEAA
jgi:hypothetical protein